MTEHKRGKGKIVMLGSMPAGEAGDMMLKKMISHYAEEAGVTLNMNVTPGTIVAPRMGPDGTLWVIVNMDGKGGEVVLPYNAADVITNNREARGRLKLGPYQYRTLLFPAARQ